MKASLYEGTSRTKATLIMTDDKSVVLKRKRERDISRRSERNVKRWVVEVPNNTPVYDKGKGGGPWTNYQDRNNRHAAPRI
jgi:hypothetical protein